MPDACIFAVVVPLAVIAWLCFRLSSAYRKMAKLNALVASMLRAPDFDQAKTLARQHAHRAMYGQEPW